VGGGRGVRVAALLSRKGKKKERKRASAAARGVGGMDVDDGA